MKDLDQTIFGITCIIVLVALVVIAVEQSRKTDNVISQLRRNRTINGRRGTQMDISVIPKDSKNVNRGGNVSTKACVIHNDPHQAVFMTKDGINIQPLFPSSYKISKKEKKQGF